MRFLTKSQVREFVEEFLEGMPNNSRIPITTNIDNEFLHIGEEFERTLSKFQTFLINKRVTEKELEQKTYDKDVRQGNFSLSGK